MPAVGLIKQGQGLLLWEEAACNPGEAEVKLLLQDIHYCHQAAPVWVGERQTDRCHRSCNRPGKSCGYNFMVHWCEMESEK